jgi:hypothetical protein
MGTTNYQTFISNMVVGLHYNRKQQKNLWQLEEWQLEEFNVLEILSNMVTKKGLLRY